MTSKKVVVLAKFFKGEINPFDGAALEIALEGGFKDVTVITMSPPSEIEAIKSLTRLNVKVRMVSDGIYAGSDTIATSFILSKTIEKLNPDIIFCGRQSINGDTSQTPAMLAQRISFCLEKGILDFKEGFLINRQGNKITIKEKTIYSFERCRNLRFPSIFSMKKEIEVWDNNILNLPKEKCGIEGSPTKVIKTYESEVGRRTCKFIDKESFLQILSNISNKENNIYCDNLISGEKLTKICYVGNLKKLANSLAKEVGEIKDNSLSVEDYVKIIKQEKPQAVLWEDKEDLKEISSRVAVVLEVGQCADCISFRVENQKLIMTRPAFAGTVTADIICSTMAFATIRTARQNSKDIIFSIGNGAISQIEDIKMLADKYNAEICCSRIVADSGKMTYSAQVGLTGKIVCPRIYVAFGISGAVQHTCAISGADTIIAVNSDKYARIFDYADYGVVEDIKNFIRG